MEHMIQPCGSTVTSETTTIVGTSYQTVLHYNGRTPQWRNQLESSSANELSLRYPHDISQTMKTCIDKVDKEHMRGNEQIDGMTGTNRPAGWAKFFAFCGNCIDESTLDHPPQPLGWGAGGEENLS